MGACIGGKPKPDAKKSTAGLKYFVRLSEGRLIIKTSTWQRDANGLFDYECTNPIIKDIKVTGNGTLCPNPSLGKLYRQGNDIFFQEDAIPALVAVSDPPAQQFAAVKCDQGRTVQ